MIDKLFICYETLSRFQQDLNAGNIKPTSIVFIEETHQIYTNGTYYGEFDNSIGPNGGLSNDQHLILSSDQIKWLFTTFANLNGLQTPWVEYTISYTGNKNAFLVDWNAPQNATVYGGNSFNALISAVDGYSIEGVTYSMGGNSYTIEADQYGYWHVTIPAITSNVEINVVTTDKPYTWSIKNYQSSQDEPNIVNANISRSARFAEGDTFGVQISTVNGYEFTHVIAQMDGDTIYENENVSTSYTISNITVTDDIEVTYGRQYSSYDVTLDEDENWTWYYDSDKQNPISEVDGEIKITHTYNTPTEFYVFGNDGYDVARILVEDSSSQSYVTYNPNTGKVTISGECASELTLSADASMQYPQLINNLTGFTLAVSQNGSIIIPTPTNLEPNTEYTFTVTLPQNYEVDTAPTINSSSMSPKSGSEVVYEETITVGTSNITISGTATAIVPKIIYGKVPASITGFNETAYNNGGCKLNEITTSDIEDAISNGDLIVSTPDIDKVQTSIGAFDYAICLIDSSYTNKSSKLYNLTFNQYTEYNAGEEGYQDNGTSIFTIGENTYKVYAQFSVMNDVVYISVKNISDF